MKELQKLHQLGLTEGEINVYEALLVLGETTKTKLAKESGVAPSNIYDITNRLLEKGLISKLEKNNVAHFSAVHPRNIFSFLDKKEEEIQEERLIAESILPRLSALFSETKDKAAVEVLTGWKGMKTIFEDMLAECSEKDTNYVLGATEGEQSDYADRFYIKYSRKREEQKIPTKIIFDKNLKSRKSRVEFFEQSPFFEVKYSDSSSFTEIMLYKNVTHIIISIGEPLIIRITGEDITKSFLHFFNTEWKSCT